MAACLLVTLVAAHVFAGHHRHGLVGAERAECASCLVAQLPGLESPAPLSLEPPAEAVAFRPATRAGPITVARFAFAAALACGPPVLAPVV